MDRKHFWWNIRASGERTTSGGILSAIHSHWWQGKLWVFNESYGPDILRYLSAHSFKYMPSEVQRALVNTIRQPPASLGADQHLTGLGPSEQNQGPGKCICLSRYLVRKKWSTAWSWVPLTWMRIVWSPGLCNQTFDCFRDNWLTFYLFFFALSVQVTGSKTEKQTGSKSYCLFMKSVFLFLFVLYWSPSNFGV